MCAVVGLSVIITSCKKTDTTVQPTCDFTWTEVANQPGQVEFKNNSKNYTNSFWSFYDLPSNIQVTDKDDVTIYYPSDYYETNTTNLVVYNRANGYSKEASIQKDIKLLNPQKFKCLMQGVSFFDFKAKEVRAYKTTNLIHIDCDYWVNNTISDGFYITLPINAQVGTYQTMTSPPTSVWYHSTTKNYELYASQSFTCSNATITVTEVTATSIKGTFTGKVVDKCSSGFGFYNITNGEFAARIEQ